MLCLSRIPSSVIWFERDTSHHPASNSFDLIHSFPTHLQRISLHLAAAAAATKCVSIEICSEYRGNKRGPNKTTHITYLPTCLQYIYFSSIYLQNDRQTEYRLWPVQERVVQDLGELQNGASEAEKWPESGNVSCELFPRDLNLFSCPTPFQQ